MRTHFVVVMLRGRVLLCARFVVRKKMAVYFTTIPCEPNTANWRGTLKAIFFSEIHPCTNIIVYYCVRLGLKFLELFGAFL